MALQCNIDARGKRVRLVAGILTLLAGVTIAFARARHDGGLMPWLFAAAFVAAGAFTIFEARAGWCALRALGFRTKL